MDFFPDLTKPLSEKDAFDLATEAWLFDEMTNDELDPDAALLAELDDDLFPDNTEGDLAVAFRQSVFVGAGFCVAVPVDPFPERRERGDAHRQSSGDT